jgi:ribosomal protein S26
MFMRSRRQPRPRNIGKGGQMQYVYCPKCGDPIAAPLTQQLTCRNCKESFPLDASQVCTGIVTYNRDTNRWRVG